MTESNNGNGKSRRTFLKEVAAYSGGIALAGYATNFAAPLAFAERADATTAQWAKQVGLELFTVRDMMTDPKSYVSTLEQLAAIGYKEVEPANGYAGMEPKDFRALLDRLGLSMPSTHSGATEGPDLEKTLEGYQVMGIKYVEISAPRAGRGPGGAGRGADTGTVLGGPGGGAAPAAGRGGPYGNGPVREAPPVTMESMKRTAALDNEHGKIAQKFGMKILIHNHAQEFAPIADNPDMRPYDVLLAETDPSLVAMQMDIGWASVAGQDILAMFKKNPGRYELWHVKDASGIPHMTPQMTMAERMTAADLQPVGMGVIDYKTIFENAELAGMKHFCVEQDNANAWGDSIAAARVSYNSLAKMLTS